MKRFLPLIALFFVGCGGSTPAIAVASLGISGAALATYCAAQGVGCSPALLSYSQTIISQASEDAAVLESGATTTAQLGQIVLNLNLAISQGRALVGLTPAQQNEVTAILSSASTVIVLIQALTPPATVAAQATVKLPPMTATDTAKIAQMRTSVTATKK